ncbi:MAG: RNA polymerase sigma factor [Acidobacteria bacterium]|nr:RNA polymerase sigma factor [Acidobacteriota bacterium]
MESRVGSVSEIWLNSELLRKMQSASDVKQKVSEVFELLEDSIFRYLVRVLDDPSEAEDVMQETFIRLYRALHKGQVIEDVRPWIFRVAHNLVLYRFRKKSPVELLDPAGWDLLREQSRDPSASPEQKVLEREQQERFAAALARLSAQEKYCLELRAEGLTYREIAQVLEMKAPTLVSFLGRVIKKLKSETYV